MKDAKREIQRRELELTQRLRGNMQRAVDAVLPPGADALGVVRRHPILSLAGAGLAGVLAGKCLRGSGDKALHAGAAVLGAGLRFAGPMLMSALTGTRR
jgi:hypothetical protein